MIAKAGVLGSALVVLAVAGLAAADAAPPASPQRHVVNLGHVCGKDQPAVVVTVAAGHGYIDVLCG